MPKRIVAVFSIFCVLFCLLNLRIADLTASADLKETAQSQRSYTLSAGKARGRIYDRNFKKLVNTAQKTVSAVSPQAETAAQILDGAEYPTESELEKSRLRQQLYEQMQKGLPFLTDLLPKGFSCDGVTQFEVSERYSNEQLAANIIGYINGDGEGITGVEQAYDSLLSSVGEEVNVHYTLNGVGTALLNGKAEIETTGDGKTGVVLTLDREIQAICENVGAKKIEKGAIVVMEPETGKLIACASFPQYDPNDIESSLDNEDGALLNRCFTAYPVGSTFKIAVAAAALDMGYSPEEVYECKGWMDVSGRPFNCHLLSGHGEIAMKTAMVESCNTYFIHLGGQIGAQKIVEYAQNLSFGRRSDFGRGLFSAAGLLPKASELPNPADVANLSFGQGNLLATPVQLCQMVSAVVNDGWTPAAQLVEGTTTDGETIMPVETQAPTAAMTEQTAATLRDFLESAVEQKDNMMAKPTRVTAAGKTATAQTGSYDEETGEEILDVWFAGYFPAEQPKYVVSVMVEHGQTGNLSAGPVFAELADQITVLEEIRGQSEN